MIVSNNLPFVNKRKYSCKPTQTCFSISVENGQWNPFDNKLTSFVLSLVKLSSRVCVCVFCCLFRKSKVIEPVKLVSAVFEEALRRDTPLTRYNNCRPVRCSDVQRIPWAYIVRLCDVNRFYDQFVYVHRSIYCMLQPSVWVSLCTICVRASIYALYPECVGVPLYFLFMLYLCIMLPLQNVNACKKVCHRSSVTEHRITCPENPMWTSGTVLAFLCGREWAWND